jgi:hypothetical protein
MDAAIKDKLTNRNEEHALADKKRNTVRDIDIAVSPENVIRCNMR